MLRKNVRIVGQQTIRHQANDVFNDQWPLLSTWFYLNSNMDNDYMLRKVWDEITYPFLNFNGCTVEV